MAAALAALGGLFELPTALFALGKVLPSAVTDAQGPPILVNPICSSEELVKAGKQRKAEETGPLLGRLVSHPLKKVI